MFRRSTDWYSPPSRDSLYFTSHVPATIMTVLAFPGLVMLSWYLYRSASVSFYLFPLVYILVIPMVWYYFTRRKTTQLYENPEFHAILDRAKARIGFSASIHVYLSTERKTLLTYARQPFLHGLQISEKAADKILSQPNQGEIVLAHELALLKREYLWLTFLRNLGAIMYGMLTEGAMLFSFMEPLFPFLYSIPQWILASIITYPWGVGLVIWYRRKSAAENEIEFIYGSNPHIASYQVFSTRNMSDVGRRYYIEEIESKIDIRNSRSIATSLGLPILASLIVSVSTYGVLSVLAPHMPLSEFVIVLLGGISFTFGVYKYESKGTGRLKQPDFSDIPLQNSDDELSFEIRKRLCEKLEHEECSVIYYTPEMMIEYGEEVSTIEVIIEGSYFWVEEDEIEELKEPELIASFLFGEYTERKSGINVMYYFYVCLLFAIMIFGGFFYWYLLTSRPHLTIILWIIFSITLGGAIGMSLGTISTRRRTAAMVTMIEYNPDYLIAAKKLVASSDTQKWRKHELERNLRRISRHLQKQTPL